MESSKAMDSNQFIFDVLENTLHDIKAPVSVIFSAIQALESFRGKNIENGKTFIETAKTSCMSIMRMIQETYETERFLNGRFVPKCVNQNIIALIRSYICSLRPLAYKQNIDILFETEIQEKIMAADKILIERIIYNLVSNSIKYAPRNSTVTVHLYEGEGSIFIDVKDEGDGISDNFLNSLFDRFFVAPENFSPLNTGLGLPIVKQIVSILNGSVFVKENKHTGNCFIISVELPVRIADEKEIQESLKYDLFCDNMVQTMLIG